MDTWNSIYTHTVLSPVRCCDTCETLIQMQQMNSSSLLAMPLRKLKRYINAYNLPSKTAIEKDDLVRIILNTRPISNESEIFYRTHRDAHSMRDEQDTANNEKSSGESPFVQMFNDLFGGGGNRTEQQQRNDSSAQQQRQEEEQRRRHWQQQQQEQMRQQERQWHQQEEQLRQQQQRQWQQQQQQQRQPPFNHYTPPPPRPSQQPLNNHTTTNNTMPSSRSRPATRKEDMLSLDDIIRSRIDPASLSVRTLKAILRANFVAQDHALEKSELVTRVQRLADERKKELESRQDPHSFSDDSLCRICCDAQQNCVFLDCGHMVTCMDCGKQASIDLGMRLGKRKNANLLLILFFYSQLVATKNECPICREPILKLVHVFRS